MVQIMRKPPEGFNEVEIVAQIPGKKENTPVCKVNFPFIWYLDEGETIIGRLKLNGKEVGAAVIRIIFPGGKNI